MTILVVIIRGVKMITLILSNNDFVVNKVKENTFKQKQKDLLHFC